MVVKCQQMDLKRDHDALVQAAVKRCLASINKNKKKGLNKQWAAGTPLWLAKYSKEVLKVAAQQDGVSFPDDVMQAAGLRPDNAVSHSKKLFICRFTDAVL